MTVPPERRQVTATCPDCGWTSTVDTHRRAAAIANHRRARHGLSPLEKHLARNASRVHALTQIAALCAMYALNPGRVGGARQVIARIYLIATNGPEAESVAPGRYVPDPKPRPGRPKP